MLGLPWSYWDGQSAPTGPDGRATLEGVVPTEVSLPEASIICRRRRLKWQRTGARPPGVTQDMPHSYVLE